MSSLHPGICPKLTEDTLAKLHSRKIFTVYDFLLHPWNDLVNHTDLNFRVCIIYKNI